MPSPRDLAGDRGHRCIGSFHAELRTSADLCRDPATGIAQFEDLVTSEAHLGRGYGDAVLSTALRMAVDEDCGTRFLTADAMD